MSCTSPRGSSIAGPVATVRPAALGLVRVEISDRDAAAHDLEIQCQANYLGYRWLFTIRLPGGTHDPVGYALAIAAGLGAEAIIVTDLAHVDDQLERIIADFDLATTAPARLWRRGVAESLAVHAFPLNDCTWEPTQLEPDCARRLWEVHRDCFPDCLSRLAASAALSAADEVD